jgi:hypothetical protein
MKANGEIDAHENTGYLVLVFNWTLSRNLVSGLPLALPGGIYYLLWSLWLPRLR